MTDLFIGVDVGTSGVRAVAIDRDGKLIAQADHPLPAPQRHGAAIDQDPTLWWETLRLVINKLAMQCDPRSNFILALDGTSGTVLLADDQGAPLTPGLMYNDGRSTAEAAAIDAVAPDTTAARGPFSGLAKVLWLRKHFPAVPLRYALNQADWLVGKLTGRFGVSDSNNALKMGYDAIEQRWPGWLRQLPIPFEWWPEVASSGTTVGSITAEAARLTGLAALTQVVLGTTDSTAAVRAAGIDQPGDAVTSLGSTLVMKVLSETPVFSPRHGVYSQPFGQHWLVGGGSNSGGVVLRHFFSDQRMAALSLRIDPSQSSGLDYYPLLQPGERFPVCDPSFPPRLEPRPENDAVFFHGLLEGLANIEKQAYDLLAELGAPYPRRVASVGGGAKNDVWATIRTRRLGIPVYRPAHEDAAYGSALIARSAKAN